MESNISTSSVNTEHEPVLAQVSAQGSSMHNNRGSNPRRGRTTRGNWRPVDPPIHQHEPQNINHTNQPNIPHQQSQVQQQQSLQSQQAHQSHPEPHPSHQPHPHPPHQPHQLPAEPNNQQAQRQQQKKRNPKQKQKQKQIQEQTQTQTQTLDQRSSQQPLLQQPLLQSVSQTLTDQPLNILPQRQTKKKQKPQIPQHEQQQQQPHEQRPQPRSRKNKQQSSEQRLFRYEQPQLLQDQDQQQGSQQQQEHQHLQQGHQHPQQGQQQQQGHQQQKAQSSRKKRNQDKPQPQYIQPEARPHHPDHIQDNQPHQPAQNQDGRQRRPRPVKQHIPNTPPSFHSQQHSHPQRNAHSMAHQAQYNNAPMFPLPLPMHPYAHPAHHLAPAFQQVHPAHHLAPAFQQMHPAHHLAPAHQMPIQFGRSPSGHQTPNNRTPSRQTPASQRKRRSRYTEYISSDEVEKGLMEGWLFRGSLRVNAKRRSDAYATVSGMTTDIYLDGAVARNRAHDGDIVIIKLLDKSKWKDVSTKSDEEEALIDLNEAPTINARSDSESDAEDVNEETNITQGLAEKLKITDAETPSSASLSSTDSKPLPTTPSTTVQNNQPTRNTPTAPIAIASKPDASIASSSSPSTPSTPTASTTPSSFDSKTPTKDTNSNSRAQTWRERIEAIKVKEDVAKGINQDFKDGLQATGIVVHVFESRHAEIHVGVLRSCHDDGSLSTIKPQDRFVLFQPNDNRVPRCLMPTEQLPALTKTPEKFVDMYIVAKMGEWRTESQFPKARFVRELGMKGDLAVENEALLVENQVDAKDFAPNIMRACDTKTKGSSTLQIDSKDLAERRDLRKWRIITIDPPTAKDLDDAVSISKNANGTFQVGVHIADVSHFVQPNDPIDLQAKTRATTVYLVDRAIPMLPAILCEQLCSLNMAVDRFAFSVVWTMDQDGNVLDEWFGRTIIRSCCRMSYDVAQLIIDGKVKTSWDEGIASENQYTELGPDEGHTVADVAEAVLHLQSIAKQLRIERSDAGALTINQVQLSIRLDKSGVPISVGPYVLKDSNRLIEEFMLMANKRVALRISQAFPDAALLRRHPIPLANKIESFEDICKDLHLLPDPEIDLMDTMDLARSMDLLLRKCATQAQQFALQLLSAKAMQVAKYFCTGSVEPNEWLHFALKFRHYTHFTSPIRRYADLIVHRQLQAAILMDNADVSQSIKILSQVPNKNQLDEICKNCNEKKIYAKKAQETSGKNYLAIYLRSNPMVVEAIVLSPGQQYLHVLIPTLGEDRRIYFDDQKRKKAKQVKTDSASGEKGEKEEKEEKIEKDEKSEKTDKHEKGRNGSRGGRDKRSKESGKAKEGEKEKEETPEEAERREKYKWEIAGCAWDEKTKTNVIQWPDGTKQVLKCLTELRVLVSAKSKGQLDVDLKLLPPLETPL